MPSHPGTSPFTRIAFGLPGAALALSLTFAAQPGARSQEPTPLSPLPLQADSPADNPTTPAKVALGRLLFWDPILSSARDIACATCHHPVHGYSDGRDLPIGTGGKGIGPARTFPGGDNPLVRRNSPTILNVGFNGIDLLGHIDPGTAPMFWDSRTRGLEAQALVPIESLEEMRGGDDGGDAGSGVAGAVARLQSVRKYRDLFRHAFPGSNAITATNLSRAIAAFERALVSTDAPYDRYLRGDSSAITGCTCWACPTTRSSVRRIRAPIIVMPSARRAFAIWRSPGRTCTAD
jgi:cytochrome c peroxidase